MAIKQPQYHFTLIVDAYYEYEINEPRGFTELQSRIWRDLDVHGCFYEVTPAEFPLAFDGIAKEILRDAFDEDGVDSENEVQLLIEKTTYDPNEWTNGDEYNVTIGTDANDPVEASAISAQIYYFDEDVIITDHSIYTEDFGSPDYTVKGCIYAVGDDGLPYGSALYESSDLTPVDGDWLTATWNQLLPAGYYALGFEFTEVSLDGANSVYVDVLTKSRTYYGGAYAKYAAGAWASYELADETLTSILNYTIAYKRVTEYLGNIDFSQAREDQSFFYCSVLRSDILIDVLNNRDKEVELDKEVDISGNPITTNSMVEVFMHSFAIRQYWEAVKRVAAAISITGTGDEGDFVQFGWDEAITTEIDESQSLTYTFRDVLNEDETDAFWIADQYEGDTHFTVEWDFNATHTIENTSGAPSDFTHKIELMALVYNAADVLQASKTFLSVSREVSALPDGNSDTNPNDERFTGSDTWTYPDLESTDYIVFYVKFSYDTHPTSCDTTYSFTPTQIQLKLGIDTVENYSKIEGYLIKDAIEDCLRKITGLSTPLDSNFFSVTGCGYYNLLTNGWNLRDYPAEPVTTSFSKLFEGLSAIFGLGYGVEQENKIKIELWEYFYQDQELIDLGDVGDYEEEVASDLIFNQVVIGFRNWANDENLVNTKEDFHTEAAWSTPLQAYKGEFIRISELICSSFLIESVRRSKYLDKPTTSTKWDDHKFLIAIEEYYDSLIADFKAETNGSITATGLTNPSTAYNLRHTIKRMLLNWGVWINSFSMRYKPSSAMLRGLYYRNNPNVVTTFLDDEPCLMGNIYGDTIVEADDIGKEDIQGGYAPFDQKRIKFTKQLTDEQLRIIKDGHDGSGDNYDVYNYGYITVNDFKGRKVSGWLLELSYNIYSKLATFTLLKRTLTGLVEFRVAWDCLPNFSSFTIRSIGNNYYQVAQWVALPKGTVEKIWIEKTDVGVESVYVFIAKVLFIGYPDLSNKIYNAGFTISEGDNELDINATIPADECYAIGLVYSNQVDVRTITQIGYGALACASDYILPSQKNTGAAVGTFTTPTTNESLRFEIDYVPETKNIKTLMIASSSWALLGNDLMSYDDIIAQQIEFKSDVVVYGADFYMFTGGATSPVFSSIYNYDNTKAGNIGTFRGKSTSALPGAVEALTAKVTWEKPVSLEAGRYVFTYKCDPDGGGTVSPILSHIPAHSDHADCYFSGLNMQYFDGATWSEFASYRLFLKIRYEPH